MPEGKPAGKKTSLAEQELCLELRIKKGVYELWKKRQAIQEDYKMS